MAGDRAQRDLRPRGVLRVAAGHHLRRRARVDVRQVEPPGDQRDERRARGVGQRRALAVADVGDADAARVEAERLGPDHVARDAAVAALPDLPEAIDEVVVANVVPAVRLHVVGVDRAQDRRHLGLGVVVRRVRVVHEDHVHGAGVQRVRPSQALVCAPLGARVDDGHRRRRAGRRASWARAAGPRLPLTKIARSPCTVRDARSCTRRPEPVQTGSATETPGFGCTSSPAVSVVQLDHAPASVRERSSTWPLPLQRAPDEVEGEGGTHHRPAGHGQAGEAHVGRPGDRGGGEEERPGEKDAECASHDRVEGCNGSAPLVRRS